MGDQNHTQTITFRTKAELAGAKSAEDALQRQIGQAKALGKEYGALEKELAAVQARMKNSAQPAGGFGLDKIKELATEVPILGKVISALATPAAAATGALSAVIGVMAKARHAFAEHQEVVVSLDAALAQNQLLTDKNRESYMALADTLSEQTAVSGEKWLSVMAKLTQFGAEPEKMDAYTEAVKNLAGVMGGDIETAGIAMSRALQGNFNLFSRYGIHVSEAGTNTEKLSNLMEELAKRGGGQLEARAQTLNGQWERMKLGLDNLLTNLGRFMNDGQEAGGVVGFLAGAFEWWAEKTAGVTQTLGGMENAAKKTKQSVDGMADSKLPDWLTQIATNATQAVSAVDLIVEEFKQIKTMQDAVARSQFDAAMAALKFQFAGKEESIEFLEKKYELEVKFKQATEASTEAHRKQAEQLRKDAIDRMKMEEKDNADSINTDEGKLKKAREIDKQHVQPRETAQKQTDEAQSKLDKFEKKFSAKARGFIPWMIEETADLKRRLETAKQNQANVDAKHSEDIGLGGASIPEFAAALDAKKQAATATEKANAPLLQKYTKENELEELRRQSELKTKQAEEAAAASNFAAEKKKQRDADIKTVGEYQKRKLELNSKGHGESFSGQMKPEEKAAFENLRLETKPEPPPPPRSPFQDQRDSDARPRVWSSGATSGGVSAINQSGERTVDLMESLVAAIESRDRRLDKIERWVENDRT